MSVSYGFIENDKSYNNDCFSSLERTSMLRLLQDYNCSPPSYSAVLAEKYHQSQQVQEIRESQELDTLLYSMRKSMQDTVLLISSYKYYYERLRLQNQFFLQKLQEDSETANLATTRKEVLIEVEQEYRQDADDSLNRMNESLEKLIEEAEQSLNTRISLSSNPDPIDSSLDNVRDDRQYKRRYLYTQWKLAITLRQLLNIMRERQQANNQLNQAVMDSELRLSTYSNNTTPNNRSGLSPAPKTLKTKPSLTSVFEHMVKDFIRVPQPRFKFKVIKSKTVKYRIMFFSTVLMAHSLMNKQKSRHVHQFQLQWQSRHQYTLWKKQIHLFIYTFKLVSSKHTPPLSLSSKETHPNAHIHE